MDLIVGQQISRYFLRKATYNLKFGVHSLFKRPTRIKVLPLYTFLKVLYFFKRKTTFYTFFRGNYFFYTFFLPEMVSLVKDSSDFYI